MMGSSAVTGIQTGPMQMSGMAGVAAARLLEWSDRREDAKRVLALARARARAPRALRCSARSLQLFTYSIAGAGSTTVRRSRSLAPRLKERGARALIASSAHMMIFFRDLWDYTLGMA